VNFRHTSLTIVALTLALATLPSKVAAAEDEPPAFGFASSYPKRVTDPEAVERGRTIYVANGCSFCHGPDARGGNGGPSLLRSQLVLQDQKGEVIADSITKGVAGTAMVGFPLSSKDIEDVAEFLHSFDVAGYDSTRMQPAQFEMGDASAGKQYFDRTCSSCHSVDGDLKGVATRFEEPINLQQGWLMPSSSSDSQVTVSFADGSRVAGTLVRIDEFLVTVKLADGSQRTITRNGDVPTVEVEDPLSAHRALLSRYRDSDIHDVTAYLVTLK